MQDIFQRTRLLLGAEGLDRLAKSTVAVFGIGGVGSFAVEALARAGIGHLILIDKDVVDPTNINRQFPATSKVFICQKQEKNFSSRNMITSSMPLIRSQRKLI